MEGVLHLLGICGDSHSHIDLMDILFMGGAATPIAIYLKYNMRRIIGFLKKNEN